jgi:uncharacterized membrane protein HdeD (DUF308 family)
MEMNPILGIIAIIFGIIVIVVPDVLGWIVGIAFVLAGLYLLYNYWEKSRKKTSSR